MATLSARSSGEGAPFKTVNTALAPLVSVTRTVNMASRAVAICSSEPPNLSKMKKLSLADVQAGSSFNFKYIEGKIAKMWPLHSAGKHKRMKLILEEETGAQDAPPPSRIIVFLTGAFAEEFIQFSDGDTVIISEALIEKSPSFVTDSIHPCNILVEKTRSRPSVWVIPTEKQTKATNTRTPQSQAASSSSTSRSTSTVISSSSNASQQQTPTTRLDDTGAVSSSSAPSTSTVNAGNPNQDTPWSSDAATTAGNPMDAWTVPDANLSPTKRTYTYTVLRDLKEAPHVNIFGVVKFFKPPYKTRGPDYCMTVTLIDQTLDPSHRGLRCQLFRDDINALPQVHAIGDIVRFHRLKISLYNNGLQGQKGSGFQCLVFDGAVNAPMEPRASSSNFTLTDDDKQRVEELRLWSSRRTQLALDNRCCSLAKMYVGQYLDLTCQVVSVAVLSSEKCAVIRVWDGTHYRGPVRVMDTSSSVNVQNDPELVHKSEGLTYDVSLYDNHMETGAKLKPGQFIKICNLHVAKFPLLGRPDGSPEMVELVLHRGTSYGRGVVTLMDWEQGVKDMIKRMEEIVQNAPSISGVINQNEAQSSLVPEPMGGTSKSTQLTNGSAPGSPLRCMQRSASVITDHFHQKTSRIADVIHAEAPNKFRLRAKVIDYLPNNIIDFIHLYCSKCKFRCRVPAPQKPASSEKTSTHKKASSAAEQATPLKDAAVSNEYNLRRATSKGAESTKEETIQGVRTRSATQEAAKESPQKDTSIESPRRTCQTKPLESERSPAEESERSSRKWSTLRKRPATQVLQDEDAPSPKKNRRGTSKMAAGTDKRKASSETDSSGIEVDGNSKQDVGQGSTASSDMGKRLMMTDIYGRNITAELVSTSDDGEEEGEESRFNRRRRQKIRVEVDSLTPEEALLMARLGLRLVHYGGVPISKGQVTIPGTNHKDSNSSVYYLCPHCSRVDDTQDVAEDAPLLRYTYCVKLFLEDGTGSIEVIADRQHAQTFFQGIRATNLHTSLDAKFQLEEAMITLCPYPAGTGFESPTSNQRTSLDNLTSHPWLECCIMSYPVTLGGTEVTKYQVFDTALALDVE
ncbi:uncharacterized protein LOC110984603 isoform X2 [Acanthaster planci]|uniref:Protection of telomeres protein 1 n=1 Tax=Acanthaster planci TaxID=133434 RepID=A0A8B7Z777_ACAPL|nr:uncharacterized protein LOC110984603 isoform X2 [Acanthaster planci]